MESNHGHTRLGAVVERAEVAVRVFPWNLATDTFDDAHWVLRYHLTKIIKTTSGEKDMLAERVYIPWMKVRPPSWQRPSRW